MKISFDLRKGKYLGYEAIVDGACLHFEWISSPPGQSIYYKVDEVANKIKQLFESSYVLKDGLRLFIDFEDLADEAHFLLWASGRDEV